MLPSQTPVHTNTQAFCKKSNGMVNNSATFSFLHLNKSYLYHLSEEAFTEHYLFKDTPLDHSIQSLVFCLQEEFGKKPKNSQQKTYHIATVTWYTAGKAACERSLLSKCKSSGFVSQFFCNTTNTSSSTPPTGACYLPSAAFQNITFCNQTEHSQ